jgi:hypothetical protein
MASGKPPSKPAGFGENLFLSLMAMEAIEEEKDEAHRRSGGEREVMEETHLDCQGRRRLFRLQIYGGGIATFLAATEVIDGDPAGMRLVLRYNEETEPPPYGEIREKIADRLSTRDIVRDPESGDRQVLNGLIRAQITCDLEGDVEVPLLIVDGEQITWEELGRLLMTYEGWGLHIKITEE